MSGFKIICENGLWRFALIPSNNSRQPMGYSVDYMTRAECEQAVCTFKNLIKENQINSADSPYVRIDRVNDKYAYKYFDEANKLLFTSRCQTKENCQKALKSILKSYIDRPILHD